MNAQQKVIIFILFATYMAFLFYVRFNTALDFILLILIPLILMSLQFISFGNSTKINDPFPRKTDINDYDKLIFPNLLEHFDSGLLILDSNKRITKINQVFLTMINEKNYEQATKKILSILKVAEAIDRVIATKKDEHVIWDYDGAAYQSKITPLIFSKDFHGVILSSFNITKLEQLEKLQSDFLADISHEIKTPLSAILGVSEILNQTQRKLTIEERKDFQDVLAKESQRLNRMILELTDLSKINTSGFQALVKSKTNLLNLLQDVKNTMKYQLEEKNLYFNLDIDSSINIFVDRDKMIQIFLNLLSNAVRYTKKGGILVKVQRIKNYHLIEFSDTGSGINQHQAGRIFDRFYRSDYGRTREQGGSGLGLAITRAIIEAHKGSITVESIVDKGTTFYITLPIDQSEANN